MIHSIVALRLDIETRMIIEETALKGVMIVSLKRIADDRGFFARTFCAREFQAAGLNSGFVQANMSYSRSRGTLRGLHYQIAPFQEAKLVRCVVGAIYDVAVDLRSDSPTFRRWLGVELSAENGTMLYVPEGFAHGYLTLRDSAEVVYQVSQFYAPESERGVRWNDPAFGIEWPITPKVISAKDANIPDFIS